MVEMLVGGVVRLGKTIHLTALRRHFYLFVFLPLSIGMSGAPTDPDLSVRHGLPIANRHAVASDQSGTSAPAHKRSRGVALRRAQSGHSSSRLSHQPNALRVTHKCRVLRPHNSANVHPRRVLSALGGLEYAFHPPWTTSANSRLLPPSHWANVPTTKWH